MNLSASISIVSKELMRYDTAGDWIVELMQYDAAGDLIVPNEKIAITVARQKDRRYEMLIAVHELVEAILCRERGITADMVDEWDIILHPEAQDPGALPGCPYAKEHSAAECIERMLAHELGVEWNTYLEETV